MRLLILGGFGFLGGRIAEHFSNLGHEVFIGSSSKKIYPPWLKNGGTILVKSDDRLSIELACQGIDVIINASGMNSADSLNDPVKAFQVNCADVALIASIAKNAGVKMFIKISTAHIYLPKLEGVISEKTCPTNYHPYAASHMAGENALLSIAKDSEMKAVVLRLSNAFGVPNFENINCWKLVINDLCRQSAETSHLIIKSSGNQYRNFIGINEACRAIGMIVENLKSKELYGIYNLGSKYSNTIKQVAKLIQERTLYFYGKKLTIQNLALDDKLEHDRLIYDVALLSKWGYNASKDENLKELDRLIQYCHASYSKD